MGSDLDVEQFIEAVRLRTPLWDKYDPMHRNLDMTNSLWNEVVVEVGGNLTVSELKQKWHNLRDCFRREIRTAEAGKKKRKWIYYNQMLFMLTPQFINEKDSKDNFGGILVKDTCRAVLPIKIEPPDDLIQIDLASTNSNNSCKETERVTHENIIEVGENSSSQETYQSEIENDGPAAFGRAGQSNGYYKTPVVNENLENRIPGAGGSSKCIQRTINDDYHFAMSIIPYMRQVPAQRKLRMRIRISEVIAQESGSSDSALKFDLTNS